MKQSSLQYERIKTFILDGIAEGDWESGNMIPSENQLAAKFSLSRMTVNRAIKELEADGIVERIQGKGTFVSNPKPLHSVLQIQGIDREVIARGGHYTCKILSLKEAKATNELGQLLEVPRGSSVWSSLILHLENDAPIQLEQRWVNPKISDNYLEQDFSMRTPHEFLMDVAPFTRGEHTMEACLVSGRVKRSLQLEPDEPCLLIHRRTWVRETVASYVKLFHPGFRFQLTTELKR